MTPNPKQAPESPMPTDTALLERLRASELGIGLQEELAAAWATERLLLLGEHKRLEDELAGVMGADEARAEAVRLDAVHRAAKEAVVEVEREIGRFKSKTQGRRRALSEALHKVRAKIDDGFVPGVLADFATEVARAEQAMMRAGRAVQFWSVRNEVPGLAYEDLTKQELEARIAALRDRLRDETPLPGPRLYHGGTSTEVVPATLAQAE